MRYHWTDGDGATRITGITRIIGVTKARGDLLNETLFWIATKVGFELQSDVVIKVGRLTKIMLTLQWHKSIKR